MSRKKCWVEDVVVAQLQTEMVENWRLEFRFRASLNSLNLATVKSCERNNSLWRGIVI
jgi:hypothetical protein